MYVHTYKTNRILDVTPVSDIAAGTPVFVGAICGIPAVDIPSGKLGALEIEGQFKFPKGSGAITAGTLLYWDEINHVAKNTGTKKIGIASVSADSDATEVIVLLNKFDVVDESESSSSSSSSI